MSARRKDSSRPNPDFRPQDCNAGYRGDQEPTAFWLGERRLEVRDIVDRWYWPQQRWFKVVADDAHSYVLRHDEASDEWELAAFRQGAWRASRISRTKATKHAQSRRP